MSHIGRILTMDEVLVELTDVHLKPDRGGWLFRDLSLTVTAGETVVIVGASGSGKTLLGELLLGMRFADQGTVRLFGEEMRPRRKRLIQRARRRIGGIGGPFGLMPMLTVAENIGMPLVIAAERKKTQRERLLRMLSEFSLLKVANDYPQHITRVENYLAQVARAAVANQPLLIIDEPSAGLDVTNYERVLEFLVKVAVSGRAMILLVSAPPPTAMPNARTLLLRNGSLE
jgi:putative ABC transport system ATP-binding protein